MVCKYMVFVPVFLAIIIHRIVFSEQFKAILTCKIEDYLELNNRWHSLLQIFRIKNYTGKIKQKNEYLSSSLNQDHTKDINNYV